MIVLKPKSPNYTQNFQQEFSFHDSNTGPENIRPIPRYATEERVEQHSPEPNSSSEEWDRFFSNRGQPEAKDGPGRNDAFSAKNPEANNDFNHAQNMRKIKVFTNNPDWHLYKSEDRVKPSSARKLYEDSDHSRSITLRDRGRQSEFNQIRERDTGLTHEEVKDTDGMLGCYTRLSTSP